MAMSPEEHKIHMGKMEAGIKQAIEILNGLFAEETREEEIEGENHEESSLNSQSQGMPEQKDLQKSDEQIASWRKKYFPTNM